jgi:hypothetical protein
VRRGETNRKDVKGSREMGNEESIIHKKHIGEDRIRDQKRRGEKGSKRG